MATKVDVIGDQNQLALLEIEPDTAGSVGDDQGGDAQAPQDANGKRNFFRAKPLVSMDAALHHGDRRAGYSANEQASAVALHRRSRKMWNVLIGNRDRMLNTLCKRSQSGAKNHSHPRGDPNAFANKSGRLLRPLKDALCHFFSCASWF